MKIPNPFSPSRSKTDGDVIEAAASRLDTLPGYVEKDFWVRPSIRD